MKKRLLTIALALCMVVSLLPVSGAAAEIVTSGSCGDDVTYTLDADGLLTISGTGDMTGTGYYTTYKNDILTVAIEPGVTSIVTGAFKGFVHLTEISIPDSVTNIGTGAFSGCTALTNVTIPGSVTSIGERAFADCTALTSIVIPDSVTTIDDCAFCNCTSLKSIAIPDSVTSMGGGLFYGCSSLEQVSLPDSMGKLAWSSQYYNFTGFFAECTSLTSITIPDSITEIGDYAFSGCTALTRITIPDSVTSIGRSAFSRCTALMSVNIPDSITGIGDSAFYRCTALASVTIPCSVGDIGSSCFSGCTSLKDLTIEEGVTRLGTGKVFSGCTALKHITLPNSVYWIPEYAFQNCNSLEQITLGDGLTLISEHAFEGCTALTELKLPKQLYTIRNRAFSGCTALRKVTGYSHASVAEYAFENCTSLQELQIGGSMSENACNGCTALETLTMTGGTQLDAYALGNCKGLKSVWLPCSLKTVAANAFRGCDALTQVQYCGTESMWNAISIREAGNAALLNASLQFVNHRPEMLVAYEGIEPTCFMDGNAPYWRCNICDKLFSDAEGTNEIAEPEALPSPGHVWTPWKLTEPATEYSGGRMDRVCTVCGQKDWRWVPPYQPSPFVDVTAGKYYYNAVLWAVNHEPQVTNGTDATHFAPNAPCKRGEVVTFLWRAMGCPEPTKTDCPFTDVSPKKFYYKAVLWAVENGITTGTSATTFGPNEPCTRGHVVTFLYRAKKAQPVAIDHPFTDLNPKGFYYKAVLWAVANDITQGATKTTFEPGKTCTRGQIVTFLQRAEMV